LLEARFPALLFGNGVGDHFLNLPAVRALVRLFPERLALICCANAHLVFYYDLRLRVICEMPMEIGRCGRPKSKARLFDADRVAIAIGPCDLLISLNPWHSSSIDRLLARLAPLASIGFFPQFQRQISLNSGCHAADLAFEIPRALDRSLHIEDFSKPPEFADRFVEQARRVLRVVPRAFRLLAVHADTARQKMWPRRRFVKLLDMFLQQRPEFLVIVLGWTDMRLDTGRHGDRVLPAYRLPLPTSALLVASSDLFVGVDSCLLHVADLFRVPGVGIFGPTNPKEWGFRFGPHRHVRARAAIATLDEQEVLEALLQLLAESRYIAPKAGGSCLR
jgi:hypothetical protein